MWHNTGTFIVNFVMYYANTTFNSYLQPGNFEHAVEDVKRYLDSAVDGDFVSAWLLAE